MTQRQNQKKKAQHNAPFFWVDQFDPGNPQDFKMQLTNLGLAATARPDRCAHPALARLPQCDPVLRWRTDRFDLGAGWAILHLCLPPARPRHLHVSLPRGRYRACDHGHDRHRLRPPIAERTEPRRVQQSLPTTMAMAPPVTTANIAMFLSEIWAQGPLERRAHPGVALVRLQSRFQPAEWACLSRYAAAQLSRST